MKMLIFCYLFLINTGSKYNHAFFYFEYQKEDVTELRDIFNLMILYLMFENIEISENDIFKSSFYDSILKHDTTDIFLKTQRYIKNIFENKIFIENKRCLPNHKKEIINYFISIDNKNLSKKTYEELEILCISVEKIQVSDKNKKLIIKKLFFIFIQECNLKILKNPLIFYRNSIFYMETMVNEFYTELSIDNMNRKYDPKYFGTIWKNRDSKKKALLYFIKFNLFEHIFLCFKKFIKKISVTSNSINLTTEEFLNELVENCKSCLTKKSQEMYKKSCFDNLKANISQFDAIRAETNKVEEIYVFYCNNIFLADSIEFWLRNFFSNKKVIEISIITFISLYKGYYQDFQEFLVNNVINLSNFYTKKKLQQKIYVYYL